MSAILPSGTEVAGFEPWRTTNQGLFENMLGVTRDLSQSLSGDRKGFAFFASSFLINSKGK